MLKLLGRANSVNVQKVMWFSAELGLDVERIDVGGPFGGNDDPEYLAKNPNGRIPTLEDGTFVLWESNAIVRHIAETRGGEPWYPADAGRRALAGQWMDWYLTTMHPPMTVIFRGLIRTPPSERDLAVIEAARDAAAAAWTLLDAHLSGHAFVTGNTPSMGDIPVGCSVYRWFNLDIKRPDLANLTRWYATLCARPQYREHVMLPMS